MMDAKDLKRLFQGILTASLVPGCGSGRVSDGVDLSRFTSSVCHWSLTELTPAEPVDFLELRSKETTDQNYYPHFIEKMGTPCAMATTPACMATYEQTYPLGGWVVGTTTTLGLPIVSQFIYTRGDIVGTVESLTDLKGFLSPIDNANEAFFMAFASLPGHYFLCRGPNARVVTDGFEVATQSGDTCGVDSHVDEHIVHVGSNGDVKVLETVLVQEGDECIGGRRPEGLAPAKTSSAPHRLGAFFAEAARLEAASVHAFERFEEELRRHRAPARFVRAARRARHDEVRHARMTRRLARRHGAEPLEAKVGVAPERSLLGFVKENAVEGCIRETFAALVATYQARHATDTRIARDMAVIAEDETRHAALAWQVAGWAEAKLTAEERAEVASLQRAAIGQLANTIAAKDAPEPRAGLPDRTESLRLLCGLSDALGLS